MVSLAHCPACCVLLMLQVRELLNLASQQRWSCRSSMSHVQPVTVMSTYSQEVHTQRAHIFITYMHIYTATHTENTEMSLCPHGPGSARPRVPWGGWQGSVRDVGAVLKEAGERVSTIGVWGVMGLRAWWLTLTYVDIHACWVTSYWPPFSSHLFSQHSDRDSNVWGVIQTMQRWTEQIIKK